MSRLRANQITNENANGAPNFPHGLTVTGIVTATTSATTMSQIVVGSAVTANSQGIDVTGIVTATSFKGDGSNLTGIDASSIKFGGAVKVQANNSGAVTTGVHTATSFSGGGMGKVIQIVQRYDSAFTRNANNTSTYAATAHYVEITPTAASSKILVNISGACNNNGNGNTIYMDIYRSVNGGSYASISPNGTSVPTAGFTLNKGDSSRNEIPMNIIYLDSPSYSLGNAIIYKLYIRNNGSGSVEVPSNPGGEPVVCIAQEIAA